MARNYPNLPIKRYKNDILKKLETHQVLIITGETGCGKSTQVPKYLHQAGYTNKKIVCLHPRCIAATTLADRVSVELNCRIGELVGYAIRFDGKSSRETMIMFVTTGLMVRLIMDDIRSFKHPGPYNDKWVKKYSVIIIDEAHERSIETDIMLGKMKQVMETNKDIKLIIMSATIDVQQFQQYYPGSATVLIKEKMDKVTVVYKPLSSDDFLTEIEKLVKEILAKRENGHILIFLHTEDQVMACFNRLKLLTNVKVLPFFSNMDNKEKLKIFDNFRRRKIIVATNVAESGLTIPDLDYVIDSGAVRKVEFNHEAWRELWLTKYISIAEAEQRKGRTGRTRSGFCYRLYEESFMRIVDENDTTNVPDYDIKFPFIRGNDDIDVSNKYFHEFPEPTIHEANLGSMILTIKSFGYENIMDFPFYVKPYDEKIQSVVKQLCNLSLLSSNQTLSRLGKHVRFIPLEPRLGKVAYLGCKYDCRDDILIIISILSVRRLLKSLQRSVCSEETVSSVEGDIFKYLKLYKKAESNDFAEDWCRENMISYHDIIYGSKVFKQLNGMLPPLKWKEKNCPPLDFDIIKKAFLSGYFQNIAKYVKVGKSHRIFSGKKVKIHRESCLTKTTEMVMFQNIHSFLNSSMLVLLNCISIDQELLLSIDPKEWKINEDLWNKIINYFVQD